jgi:hypothetical protein
VLPHPSPHTSTGADGVRASAVGTALPRTFPPPTPPPPTPPLFVDPGGARLLGGGGGEGDGGCEGEGPESFENDHVRWERERFSWSTGTLPSGAAGDSSCRGGGGSEGRRGALCATPARPSKLAHGVSYAGAGQMHEREPVGNGYGWGEEWSENDVDVKAAAARGCGGAWGESWDSRPSTLGEWRSGA